MRVGAGLKPFMDWRPSRSGLEPTENWVRKCVEWSRSEVSRRRQVLTLALGAAIFLLTLPALLITAGRRLDCVLGVAGLLEGMA